MTDQPNDEPEKKIIIDEDWKSRVEAEKEELERKKQHDQEEKGREEPASAERVMPEGPLPPSLEVLVSSLAMQAMMALGLMRDPANDKPEVHLDQAKHLIDTIAMLEQKTEGNRTPDETAVLSSLLHELRLGYLAVEQQQAAPPSQADR